MFATWCCRQCGKRLPSPTMNERPQAFAPRTFESQRVDQAAYGRAPVSWSYRLAFTDRPAPCEVVSHTFQGKPKPNASAGRLGHRAVEGRADVVQQALAVTARPAGSPAAAIAD